MAEIRPLGLKDTCATLAIKCYDEQLIDGEERLVNAIEAVDSSKLHVVAIKHSKSKSKAHWHILIKGANRDKKSRVSTLLKMLNIKFRPGIDDDIIENHGLETVGKFSNYATYLLHKTIEAERAGKEPYEKSDFVTNLESDEIESILEGYSITKKRLGKFEFDTCLDLAEQAGYELRDVYEFIDSLRITGLKNTQRKNLIKNHEDGVRRLKAEHKELHRLFIYMDVRGMDKNRVVSSVKAALEGKRIAIVDYRAVANVEASDNALIVIRDNINDKYKPVCTDYISDININEKGSGIKGLWAGKIVVILSFINDTFSENNFFKCEVKSGELVCKKTPELHGTREQLQSIKDEYKLFRDGFNKAFSEYDEVYENNLVDFSDIND